jgi:hypothetical protein
VDVALPQAAVELLTKEAEFVYNLYQTAELEVRATERYVLLGLGAMYSYLVTKSIPDRFRSIAWYAPTFVVLFAGIRALGLGLRQKQLLQYLDKVTEARILQANSAAGWAGNFRCGKAYVAWTAGSFYVLLACMTIVLALRMTRKPPADKPAASETPAPE